MSRGSRRTWQVLPANGGSLVRLTSEIGGGGPMRLMRPMIERMVRKTNPAELAELKKLLESVPNG